MGEDVGERYFKLSVQIYKEYWNVFDLWPDEEFRSKAKQVYFQMLELTFKSIHFIEEDPMKMVKFETDGDKLRWKARDG